MGIIEELQHENAQLKRELSDFMEEVRLWMEDLGDDVKGNEAAARFISVSVSTLLQIRDIGEYAISYRKEGVTPVYSRRSLVAYKKRKKERVAA
jgi:hypothetical protein